jgi:hypothetical protein
MAEGSTCMGHQFLKNGKKVLCIDPGSTHLVAAIFDISGNTSMLLWNYMFRVDHDPAKIANACKLMSEMCSHYAVADCLLEYQAPMGAPTACRWNCYIEGAIAAVLSYKRLNVHTLQPSVVKRKLKLATGNYAANKKAAFEFASANCAGIDSHHLADCYVLAEYWKREVHEYAHELIQEVCEVGCYVEDDKIHVVVVYFVGFLLSGSSSTVM